MLVKIILNSESGVGGDGGNKADGDDGDDGDSDDCAGVDDVGGSDSDDDNDNDRNGVGDDGNSADGDEGDIDNYGGVMMMAVMVGVVLLVTQMVMNDHNKRKMRTRTIASSPPLEERK